MFLKQAKYLKLYKFATGSSKNKIIFSHVTNHQLLVSIGVLPNSFLREKGFEVANGLDQWFSTGGSQPTFGSR
jgi:hypothetical protein